MGRTLCTFCTLCTLTCVAAMAAFPAAAAAQQDARIAEREARAIELGWSGGGTLGAWLRAGKRIDAGLEAGYIRNDEDSGASWTAALRPALKVHLGGSEGPVVPYWIVGLALSWTATDIEIGGSTTRTTARSLGGFTGLGLSWFPTERVSLGGHVGVEAAATRRVQPGLGGIGGPAEVESTGYRLGTLSSGVRLQLWL